MSSIWTHVGAACMPDEGSTGKYEANAARFRHKGSFTGDIFARCNVTNPRDDGLNPGWDCLEVVYSRQADTDQVTAELIRVSNETGGVYTLATLDSNNFGTSPDEQTKHVDFHHDFNFEHFAYYVQIKVSRKSSSAGHNPSISIVRLYEEFI
jgi:hypothetical protein